MKGFEVKILGEFPQYNLSLGISKERAAELIDKAIDIYNKSGRVDICLSTLHEIAETNEELIFVYFKLGEASGNSRAMRENPLAGLFAAMGAEDK